MKQINSMFTKYDLTPEEHTEASKFTTMQECKLQTMLATLVEEKVLLPYDPVNSMAYVQREAELQGQIRIIQQLLAESQIARSAY